MRHSVIGGIGTGELPSHEARCTALSVIYSTAPPAAETPVPAQDAQPREIDIAITVDRIEKAASLKVHRIIRKWAGLRSFVADGVPVVGYDKDAPGFLWCAGQGGYGIETSWAMGEATAALARGEAIPSHIGDTGIEESDLSPRR